MRRAVCAVVFVAVSGGALARPEGFGPDTPAPEKKSEVYETVPVWDFQVEEGPGWRTVSSHTTAEAANEAARKWLEANKKPDGTYKDLRLWRVQEGAARVPLRRNSGSDKSTPPDKIEIAPPRPFVDPGAVRKPATPAPSLKGKKAAGQIGDLRVTFEFADGGRLSITGDATGSGKWTQDGSALSMETQVATYRGNVTADGGVGLRFWKDGSKPLAEWRFNFAGRPAAPAGRNEGALAGTWTGWYAYPRGDERISVDFEMKFTAPGGNTFKARTTEANTFGEASAPKLFADCAGAYDPTARKLSWTKAYDGTGGVSHSIDYRGTLSADGATIEGTWTLGDIKGTFRIKKAP